MAITTKTLTVDEERAGRADLVIRGLAETSYSQARGMIDRGCVLINGTPCQSIGQPVAIGDLVALRYDPTQRYREKKQKRWDDRTFTIAYEDDHLIVVDKAARCLTVPTDNGEQNTLVDRVSIYLSHSRTEREAWLVHRLDRDVSGLLVFGKQEKVAQLLIEQFKQQKPERVYCAIVAGLVVDDEGTFESELATGKNLDRYATKKSRHTETAITHYRVIKRLVDATHVEVTLETGRRNQIRVHFADAGHPVLGDPRYGKELADHPRWIRKRIALHARTLGFHHPVTGEPVKIESELPSTLAKFVASKPIVRRPEKPKTSISSKSDDDAKPSVYRKKTRSKRQTKRSKDY